MTRHLTMLGKYTLIGTTYFGIVAGMGWCAAATWGDLAKRFDKTPVRHT